MAYSEIKVIAGGLAHIPIIIGFFYFIENKIFAKKTVTTEESKGPAKKSSKPESPAKEKTTTASQPVKNAPANKALQKSISSDKNIGTDSSSSTSSTVPPKIEPIKKTKVSEANPDKTKNSDPTVK